MDQERCICIVLISILLISDMKWMLMLIMIVFTFLFSSSSFSTLPLHAFFFHLLVSIGRCSTGQCRTPIFDMTLTLVITFNLFKLLLASMCQCRCCV